MADTRVASTNQRVEIPPLLPVNTVSANEELDISPPLTDSANQKPPTSPLSVADFIGHSSLLKRSWEPDDELTIFSPRFRRPLIGVKTSASASPDLSGLETFNFSPPIVTNSDLDPATKCPKEILLESSIGIGEDSERKSIPSSVKSKRSPTVRRSERSGLHTVSIRENVKRRDLLSIFPHDPERRVLSSSDDGIVTERNLLESETSVHSTVQNAILFRRSNEALAHATVPRSERDASVQSRLALFRQKGVEHERGGLDLTSGGKEEPTKLAKLKPERAALKQSDGDIVLERRTGGKGKKKKKKGRKKQG